MKKFTASGLGLALLFSTASVFADDESISIKSVEFIGLDASNFLAND
ncbi:MAG: hypothetical protein ACQEXQ_19650 [Bacillota bacterium]